LFQLEREISINNFKELNIEQHIPSIKLTYPSGNTMPFHSVITSCPARLSRTRGPTSTPAASLFENRPEERSVIDRISSQGRRFTETRSFSILLNTPSAFQPLRARLQVNQYVDILLADEY
jgi:hypothetical protein